MAISFREYPWYLQALVFFALALVIIGAGEYVPMSPVAAMRNTLQEHHTKDSDLNRQVAELQVYERRNAEFKIEMAALEKQLDTLKMIVPEEKEVDEFMRLVQGAASASGVQIRRLTAEAVVPKDYHYELPFEIEVDGPYFNIEDFFARLSRLSRIINVGDLTFNGLADPRKLEIPGTSRHHGYRQMPDYNFLQQARGLDTSPGCKESTRPSLGGIEPTDYATRKVFTNSVAAGTAGGSRDVRGGAGTAERAAVKRARPIEAGLRGIAASARPHRSPRRPRPRLRPRREGAGESEPTSQSCRSCGCNKGGRSGQSSRKSGGAKGREAACRKTGRGKGFRGAP